MRSTLLFLVFALAISLLGKAQTEPKPKPITPAGQQSGAVEQALIRLDRELMDAVKRNDRRLLEKTESSRFVFVNPGGGIEEKAEAMAGSPPTIESLQTEKVVVRVEGDTAVLTGTANVKGKLASGLDITGRYTYMRVFVKQKGEWRLVAMAAVPIVQAQPTPSSTPQATPSPTP